MLRFWQGVGRLVRRATDRGVVILADPRCLTRSYGSFFSDALPVPLGRSTSVDDAVLQAVEFLGAASPEPMALEGEPA